MAREWGQIEPGWYTSELGGIVDEGAGKWFYYPRERPDVIGPFKTLAAAKEAAEDHGQPA